MKTLIIRKEDIPGRWIYWFLFLSIILLLLIACATPRIHRITVEPSEFNIANASDDFPYIKLHIQNGRVYLLNRWKFNENKKIITGEGDLLDINRNILESDTFSVPFDKLVLVETNRIDASSPLIALSFMTGLTVAGAAYCIINPKACFGSCPTFYVHNGNDFVLQAEGFSSSVTPSLEDRDVDAISKVKNTGSNTITAHWFVEGQFYSDNTYTLLLGGDVTTINLPLNPGVETLWNLELSDPDIAEGNYPNFAVKDLVAYYTK